jgi:hypothetical protein
MVPSMGAEVRRRHSQVGEGRRPANWQGLSGPTSIHARVALPAQRHKARRHGSGEAQLPELAEPGDQRYMVRVSGIPPSHTHTQKPGYRRTSSLSVVSASLTFSVVCLLKVAMRT